MRQTERLKEIYKPEFDAKGNDKKPSLQPYPHIPWETLDLEQFSLVPKFFRPMLSKMGAGWGKFFVVPIETGRGCPYGCEFCTVTGFFGDSIRFRTNESVVEELLRLKKRAKEEKGQIAVFFIDDNLAINKKRLKVLLRDIIAADAQLPWVAQISANLLKDEELVDLISESGGKWIFIGMESIDPENMASVNKNFSKPGDYKEVLERLAKRNIYAITSFIFGMDNDTTGVAARTVEEIESWSPGLPVFGQLTPFPATPLYTRLEKEGRLDQTETLARIRAFHNGAHAEKNVHHGCKSRSRLRLVKIIQPRTQCPSTRSDQRCADPISHQPFCRSRIFPWNLLSANEKKRLDKNALPKPQDDFEFGKRRFSNMAQCAEK